MYGYVGCQSIKFSVSDYPIGVQIKSKKLLEQWIKDTNQKPNNIRLIAATFVIDLQGYLRIAERHSEHIACSGGEKVFSAGEIFLSSQYSNREVIEISNQSTGFCPESKSWLAVQQALNRIPLNHPGEFTTKFIFRRCTQCNQINIVKENLFICSVCNAKLSSSWNCGV